MKKILSYILISLIISVNLLAPFSVGFGNQNKMEIKKNEAFADNCKIVSVTWTPATSATLVKPDPLNLNIKTLDCAGRILFLKLEETNGLDKVVSEVRNVLVSDSDISINFKPGENFCSDGQCAIKYTIYLNKPDSASGQVYSSSDTDFVYQCTTKPDCNDALPWSYTLDEGTTLSSPYSFEISPVIQTTDTSAVIDLTIVNANAGKIVAGITTTSTELVVNVDLKNKDGSIKETKSQTMTKDGGVKNFTFAPLLSDTDYGVLVSIIENATITPPSGMPSNIKTIVATMPEKAIHTNPAGKQSLVDQGPVDTLKMNQTPSGDSIMPACAVFIGKGTIMGCVAQGFYYIFFVPTSYLFALAGTFFDYAFSYSVQDSSYRSSFVVEGWGLVRDFCNMFFIFIMLYVAIGTILSLHSMKTKETIINVVIIGLFINFSLFATQLIIDASNITARVFYNSDSIKLTPKGPAGAASVVAKVSENGVIPLSAALVNKINPQSIIINAKEINKINNNSNVGVNEQASTTDGDIGVGQFILIVLIAAAVNIIGFSVFLIVGVLFIARVIGLWLAMIISPLAFFTYILPEMASTKMIGWQNWWSDTLKLAFLAPVFIFFMYIILKFLQIDLISDAAGKTGLDFLIATLIPFAFIMILMIKAKNIAVDMSGEMGASITKAMSSVGPAGAMKFAAGVYGGAIAGGAAALGKGTMGRLGSGVADNEKLKAMEKKGGVQGFFAKNLRNVGTAAGKTSFDARNTKVGGDIGLGKGKTGGFAQAKLEQKAKDEKRAKELEPGENTKENVELRAANAKKKKMENEINPEVEAKTLEKETAQKNLTDADNKLRKDPQNKENIEAADKAQKEYDRAKDALTSVNNGGAITDGKNDDGTVKYKKNADGTVKYATDSGRISKEEYDKTDGELTKAQTAFVNANSAQGSAAGDADAQVAAAKKNNEDVEKETFNKATAEGAKIKNEAESKGSQALAQAERDELAAIAALSLAKEAAAKNPSKNNKDNLARASELKDSATKNTKNASTSKQKLKDDADLEAGKLLTEARNKATIERDEADKKAEKEAIAFKEAALKTKEEAEKNFNTAKAKMEEAKKSKQTIDPNTGKEVEFGTTLKEARTDAHHKDVAATRAKNASTEEYAKSTENRSTILNLIATGGVYSAQASKIAAHNMRMGTKTEVPSSSGGGAPHAKPAPASHAPAKPAGAPPAPHAHP